MTKQNSICPIIRELERIYDAIAKTTGLDKIAKRPLITIQSGGNRKNTLGWYWNNKWKFKKKNISEINLCAEEISNKTIETLIHEMTHYHNASLNIMDCNQHQYHNKKFKERAESYGLNVKKEGRHGWSTTSISPSLQKVISKIKIKRNIFTLYRIKMESVKSVTKMIKYSCGCTIVRCATDLQAKCNSCGKNFGEC